MFKKEKYVFIKNAINPTFANFLFKYLLLKEQVCSTLNQTGYAVPGTWDFGIFGDNQVPNAYATYGDIAFETLLTELLPIMEKATGFKLIPTYAYSRLYREGNELPTHKDRDACDISTTLFLGGNEWPIYFIINGKKKYMNMKPGDMVAYKGTELLHGRDKFIGAQDITCGQVFLHYNKKTKENKNLYDGRPHLGICDKNITEGWNENNK